jgi:hypothetical protein
VLAAFRPPGPIDEVSKESAGDVEDDLLAATGGREGYVDRFRRMFALKDADPTDPRVDADRLPRLSRHSVRGLPRVGWWRV